MAEVDKNKLLAKNTIMLYIRMIVVMVIQLYTSRVVLDLLGVVDFGIYNVVGGIVVLFSFLNISISAAYQRFLTFELGRENIHGLKDIFSMALLVQVCLVAIILLLGESVGLWFLNTQMEIPDDRMFAANVVYQLSILSCALQIIIIPFSAEIIAHEKMDVLAWLSIWDVVLKLFFVIGLAYISFDRLIAYSCFVLFVAFVDFFLYGGYCKIKFEEVNFKFIYNKSLLSEVGKFTGWNVFSDVIYVLNNQGVNILLNIYFGPVVNAARGVCAQVLAAIHSFIYNFQTAAVPQITKSYATNEIGRLHRLITVTSKVSFFLLLFIAIPLYFETDFILGLWLKEVPAYTSIFVKIVVVTKIVDVMAGALTHANRATGQIKKFQILTSLTSLFSLLLSFFFIIIGLTPEWVYISLFIASVAAQVIRIILVLPMISMGYGFYLREVMLRSFMVLILSIVLPLISYLYFESGVCRFIYILVLSFVSIIVFSFFIGFNEPERKMILGFIMDKFNKNGRNE